MACIFCQIISGEIEGQVLYQDEEALALRDIHPQAPVHILLIPKRHIPSLADLGEESLPLMSHLVKLANEMAKKEGVAEKGYRLVVNCGPQGGQVVPHLHLHLLGGRQLKGEMG